MGIFSNNKLIFILLVMAGVLGIFAYQHLSLSQAQAKVQELEAKNVSLTAANEKNLQTINALKQEKLDIQASLEDLAADKKKNAQLIASLSANLKNARSNPANTVKLSPVLQGTLAEIEARRRERENGPVQTSQ